MKLTNEELQVEIAVVNTIRGSSEIVKYIAKGLLVSGRCIEGSEAILKAKELLKKDKNNE